MESLGEKLREARRAQGITVDQVARDTNISKHYLTAIESEDFSTFPGDTYVMGFIRNYAEYVGLEAEEVIGLYRSLQLQEQPVPFTELLETHSGPSPAVVVALIVLALAVLAGGGYALVRFVILPGQSTPGPTAAQTAAVGPVDVNFVEDALVSWYVVGQRIQIPLSGGNFAIRLESLDDSLHVSSPGRTFTLRIGGEELVDLDGDGQQDIRILFNDLDASSQAPRVNLGLYRNLRPTVAAPPPPTQSAATGPSIAAPVRAVSLPIISVRTAAAPVRFTVALNFQGHCLLRYSLDGGLLEQRFFRTGERISLDAVETVRLWFSNAGVVFAQVERIDVDLGSPGQVAARSVAWRQADDGDYRLQVIPLF